MTELDHRELMCVGQMAATLAAASYALEYHMGDEYFAHRAWAIYRAVTAAKHWREPAPHEALTGANDG